MSEIISGIQLMFQVMGAIIVVILIFGIPAFLALGVGMGNFVLLKWFIIYVAIEAFIFVTFI